MTSFIAAGGSGRSTSLIPASPAAWSVTTIAFIGIVSWSRELECSLHPGSAGTSVPSCHQLEYGSVASRSTPPERFELPTFGSVDRRSIQLSYGRLRAILARRGGAARGAKAPLAAPWSA